MHPPRPIRFVLLAVVTGALTVSAAWAGAGLAPVHVPTPPPGATDPLDEAVDTTPPSSPTPTDDTAAAEAGPTAGPTATSADLEPGWALVGAAKTSIEPRPDDYGGEWETDPDACERMDERLLTQLAEDTEGHLDHLAHAGSPWPENPNCIYMGGFGIGPANAVEAWDQQDGLWMRSVAIGDGTDTLDPGRRRGLLVGLRDQVRALRHEAAGR